MVVLIRLLWRIAELVSEMKGEFWITVSYCRVLGLVQWGASCISMDLNLLHNLIIGCEINCIQAYIWHCIHSIRFLLHWLALQASADQKKYLPRREKNILVGPEATFRLIVRCPLPPFSELGFLPHSDLRLWGPRWVAWGESQGPRRLRYDSVPLITKSRRIHM